jgi:hypothetical protein
MTLSNKAYNVGKFTAQVFLPAVATLYFAMAQIWHLPKAEEVVGSITTIDAFLGVLLGISTQSYKKTAGAPDGDLIVSEVDGEKYLGLGVNSSLAEMTSKPTVTLNVVDNSATSQTTNPPVNPSSTS